MITVAVPAERVAVLIGKKGEVKSRIEKKLGVKLLVSKDGRVKISSEDPCSEWDAQDVVKAMGRGFKPEKAFKLFSQKYSLKIVNLKELFGSEKAIKRIKGRIIGEDGKSRRMIEETSGADLCVYGSTVSIIGDIEELELASEAVSLLIQGAKHGRVFKTLEQKRRALKEERGKLWQD